MLLRLSIMTISSSDQRFDSLCLLVRFVLPFKVKTVIWGVSCSRSVLRLAISREGHTKGVETTPLYSC